MPPEQPARSDEFLDAPRQARNPGVKNPGAVLITALKRDHGWTARSPPSG